MSDNVLFLFTKPARPGRVKTRLIGELTPEQAAALHAAFRDDVAERLAGGSFDLELAWALDDGEAVPESSLPGRRQEGADLGERLYNALQSALVSAGGGAVGAIGSDHPEIALATVEDAFQRLAAGADLVVGPAADGGYYLIALRSGAVHRDLFTCIAWSTDTVFSETMRRAERLGLKTELLPEGHDVDRPDDLRRLVASLAAANGDRDVADCPRTRALLVSWGRLAS